MSPTCRFYTKRRYDTRDDARRGARNIKTTVEARGEVYGALYPYICPDGDHWHLSHYQQGFKTCATCRHRVSAFKGADGTWVVNAHQAGGRGPTPLHQCEGSMKPACVED